MEDASVVVREPGALISGVVEFVRWLGDGRKLTQTGRLTMTDARVLVGLLKTGDRVDPVIGDRAFRTPSSQELFWLNLLFAWAKAARLARVVNGRVLPVAKNAKMLQSPERLLAALLDALPRLGEAIAPQRGWLQSPVSLDFPVVARLVLDELEAADAAVPSAAIYGEIWAHIDRTYVIEAEDQQIFSLRSATDRDVQYIIKALNWVGAVDGDEQAVALTSAARVALDGPCAPFPAGESILELVITLRGSADPEVWRKILVPAGYPLPRVHAAIQGAMGWTNSHLHQFTFNDVRYSDHTWDEPEDGSRDERGVLFGDLVRKGSRFEYEYDFGDGWDHDVVVVDSYQPAGQERSYPACATGEGACPPEDCGGIWGYRENLLPALADPKHPEHETYRTWLGLAPGETLDPRAFDVATADRRMRRKQNR